MRKVFSPGNGTVDGESGKGSLLNASAFELPYIGSDNHM